MKLASGIADITYYKKSGIKVGLGTDGAGSTNTLDMFEEIKTAALLQKVIHKKASCMDAFTALSMATREGAEVLGLQEKIGTLEEGKLADIILVDLNKPHLQPIHDVYSDLVYSATGQDVDTTIINGKIIMENRKLIQDDENIIMQECERIKNKYMNKNNL